MSIIIVGPWFDGDQQNIIREVNKQIIENRQQSKFYNKRFIQKFYTI